MLLLLHYGYQLAFYHEDPKHSPYDYQDDDQIPACREVWNQAIAEFEAAPEKICFHTIRGAGHALNFAAAPEEYIRIVGSFIRETM